MARTDERPVIAGLRVTWQEFAYESPPPSHESPPPLRGRVREGGSGPREAENLSPPPLRGRVRKGGIGPATRRRREPGEGKRSFGLWVPDDPDGLLDGMTQDEFERSDERMPYFSAVWPSAESLVAKILSGLPLGDLHVLDLGCGLGPCGFAAACRGGRVTFFDWEPRALELVAASARAGGWPREAFDFVVGDWRNPPSFGPFDLVLGADVLYERRNGPAVVTFLAGHLRPGAEAWIADPGRPQSVMFPSHVKDLGLDLLSTELLPPLPHGFDITLFRLAASPLPPRF